KEKGDILSRMKRHEEALSAYQKTIQLDPKDAFVQEQIGDIFSQLERFADAVKAYDRALHIWPDWIRVYRSKAEALENLKQYEQALATYNKALKQNPNHFFLLVGKAGVLKKLLRYEEANAEYSKAAPKAPQPFYEIICLFGEVDLKQVAEAKARLEAASKEVSDEAIKAEIHLMHKEKQAAELKASLRASPLFQPMCLLMQEKQEWSGTPKQFKELICSRFPNEFATWYRAPYKYVEELKKIAPELRIEGLEVSAPPETTLVTLAYQIEKDKGRSLNKQSHDSHN
ncbi:MAG TPA: tetratricopeptide repeat protein, partial [Ktedonobacteraceae bacterium]|nr:tetratricopeptide repeat protein [Ktedonobacteraceae bacterium]